MVSTQEQLQANTLAKPVVTDGISAMKSRYDEKKVEWGIQEMILLYETTSANFANQVEAALIDHSMTTHLDIALNSIAGKGGRDPNPDAEINYYVYVAYRWNIDILTPGTGQFFFWAHF